MRRSSNFVRDDIVLSEATSRDYALYLSKGNLLECLIFEGHDCIFEATSEVTLEVQVCIVFVIFMHLGFVFRSSSD